MADSRHARFSDAVGRLGRLGYGAALRTRRSLHPASLVPGLLSVVVPAYNVEAYLDECLIALRFQYYRDVEILVVNDGSPDHSAEIAHAHARRDLRVRVIDRPNGGLSAARNTGVPHAKGEFLTFVDSDDTCDPYAFTAPIEALRRSGSDFALTLYDRLERNGRYSPAGPWIRAAHERVRLATTLEESPDAMVNAVAWSKVYRRRFWDAADLTFPEGRLYEDQPVSMEAFARARTFDVLPQVGVHWRIRGDGSSISQASSTARNLAEHNDAVRASLAVLRAHDHESAAQARAVQQLANNMPFFTRHLATADDEFWGLLREAVALLSAEADRAAYAQEVRAEDKVLYELILAGRREDATAFIDGFGQEIRRYPTRREADGVHVDLPLADGLPADVTLLARTQFEHVHRLMQLWFDADGLHLGGWTFLRNIDLATNPPLVELTLVGTDGSRHAFTVTACPDVRADVQGEHWQADYRNGGFAAVLPGLAGLAGLSLTPGRYVVELRLSAAGVSRTSVIDDLGPAGSSTRPHGWVLPGGLALAAAARRDERYGRDVLTLDVTQARTWAESAEVTDGGLLRLTLAGHRPRRVAVKAGGRTLISVRPLADGPGRWRAEMRLPEGAPAGSLARSLVFLADDRPLLAPPATPAWPGLAPTSPRTGPARQLTTSATGALELAGERPLAPLTTLATLDTLDGTAWRVRVAGPLPVGHTPVLASGEDRVEGLIEGDELVFPLTLTRWDRPELALRRGKYAITLRAPNGRLEPVLPAADLLDALPVDRLATRYRAVLEVVPSGPGAGGLALVLEPPLAEDERSPRNQHRLRTAARVAEADSESVFFRALYGESATCNGLGVHTELRRRGTTLTLYWSVRDYSIPVPEGATAVIENTAAWHHAMARSRYHMINVHQTEWFVKPHGQVMIETMHGYPYKVMGHDWWAKGDFPRNQVASFDRRARDWDVFVSPATYATPLLEAAFLTPAGAHPQVLTIGYPRNDILLSDEAEAIRERTRADLGITPEQKVALYAPTFRDYLSADDLAADRVEFFDAAAAATALGPGYVVLLRGHAFNARAEGGRLFGVPGVLDVTDHPDVNDLILASDAAILDYSSLRFDYALTGKPMIFLVPDLARYDAARGGVIPYGPTAPGPQVTSTGEVVTLLRDLAKLRTDYAEALARFRADYTDLDDGHAAARLVDAVFVPRGDAPPA